MVRYFNPGGHNWGPKNLDGYGITQIVVAVLYSIFFYSACAYLWSKRFHPVIKIRKIGLALMSILILHVYLFMIFMVYPLNGKFPCQVEFWIMSTYLPIGIGLFSAQNQQLLLVSRQQNLLVRDEEVFQPMYVGRDRGPRYWLWSFKVWWRSASSQNKYESFVFVGMFVQFVISLIIYCSSRKFNDYGFVSSSTGPGLCRRGWEWAPSIVWQAMWNFFFGPYLLWQMRGVARDMYNWRLQTTLAIVAGIPGTPMWLAAVYSDSLNSINRWFVPAAWFVPGLVAMELVTIIFPIIAMFKHDKTTREVKQALEDFDFKKANYETGSTSTPSTGSKRSGRMYSMDSLDECLEYNYDGFQIYAACIELSSENIVFLVKVLQFKKVWDATFSNTTIYAISTDYARARIAMFRIALSIYVTLVHADTASYPINIESPVYAKLESIFGAATALVATTRRNSISSTPSSAVTPWDEPPAPTPINENEFPMHVMPSRLHSGSNDSSDNIMRLEGPIDPNDPLAHFDVPDDFNDFVFDKAFRSIRYMVWSESYQRYMAWKRTSNSSV